MGCAFMRGNTVCLDVTAFTYVSQLMIADAEITYDQMKIALANKFTGAEYKRKLEILTTRFEIYTLILFSNDLLRTCLMKLMV